MKRLLALVLCLALLLPVLSMAEMAEEDIPEEDLGWVTDESADDAGFLEDIVFVTSDKDATYTKDQLEMNTLLPEDDVINILLIGVDSRPTQKTLAKDGKDQLLRSQLGPNNGSRKRSDVVMILSIDMVFGTLKITSISRDTLVEIPRVGQVGYWEGPINEAFAIAYSQNGKFHHASDAPDRLVKTVNHNFGLNIQYWIATNFYGVEEIIEYFGGVDVELTAQEARYVNRYIQKNAKAMRNSYDTHSEGRVKLKETTGVQHLDGLQGLVFARYRTIANQTDIIRTGRTRRLLQALARPVAEKLKSREIDFTNTLMDIAQYFSTNMNLQAMVGELWPAVRDGEVMNNLDNLSDLIEEYRIPGESGFSYQGDHVKITNMKKTAEDLQEFIYGEVYGFDR